MFTGILYDLIEKAKSGSVKDVDYIMEKLTIDAPFKITRFVDFALSYVDTKEGKQRVEHYLFNGSLIQRNYASLYFNRRGEWEIVKAAFKKGLIDEIQAFAR